MLAAVLLLAIIDPASHAWAQGAAQISAGASHTCAIDSNGQLWCWGRNDTGALGLGDTIDRSFPNPVPGMDSVTAVATGDGLTCAINSDETLWCWGRNTFGQLGLGDQQDRNAPVQVDLSSAVLAVEIAPSGAAAQVCALTQPGIWCWGSGFLGQGPSSQSDLPLLIPDTANATGLAVGGAHSCIITAGNAVQCWGVNNHGQLGLGDNDNRNEPTAVPGLANVQQLVAGFQHTCARTVTGALWCWGRHSSGQLGLGGITSAARPDRLQPTEVSGFTLVNQLAAGLNHTCAIRADSELFCFGANRDGQIGNGSTLTAIASPARVSAIGLATAIAAGSSHSCAIDDEGGLWCWGDNAAGQLGLEDITDTTRPLRMPVFPLEQTQTTLLTFQPAGTYQLGQPVTFRADVTGPDVPAGSQVSFRNDGVEFASAPLDASGRAELSFADSPPGLNMPITARYMGTPLLAPSISDTRGLFVSAAATATILEGPTSANLGQPVSLLVTVTSPWLTPFGSVEILRATFPLAESELDANGQASFQLDDLPAGTNELRARMSTSESFLGSQSDILSITIALPDPIFRSRFEP